MTAVRQPLCRCPCTPSPPTLEKSGLKQSKQSLPGGGTALAVAVAASLQAVGAVRLRHQAWEEHRVVQRLPTRVSELGWRKKGIDAQAHLTSMSMQFFIEAK